MEGLFEKIPKLKDLYRVRLRFKDYLRHGPRPHHRCGMVAAPSAARDRRPGGWTSAGSSRPMTSGRRRSATTLRCVRRVRQWSGINNKAAGDHQADVRAEVRRESVDASDPGPESATEAIGWSIEQTPDGPRAEGPFRPVLHLKTEEPKMSRSAAFYKLKQEPRAASIVPS